MRMGVPDNPNLSELETGSSTQLIPYLLEAQ